MTRAAGTGWVLHRGDVRRVLPSLPAESVDCVITSPPYWQIRNYGHRRQLGLEPTPTLFVRRLVRVFREIRRVLKPRGTVWLNLGDTYIGGRSGGVGSSAITSGRNHSAARAALVASNGGTHRQAEGLKPKDLVGIPWRVALALQADGWFLRSDIIWEKPSAMPESVRDRPTRSHEYLFLLSKSERYYYDQDAIKEPVTGGTHSRGSNVGPKAESADRTHSRANKSFVSAIAGVVEARNKRSIWRIPQEPTSENHFATFPRGLVRPCVLAGCPAGGIVLDPFAGMCTTGAEAIALGRRFEGVEIVREYADLGAGRLVAAVAARGNATPVDAQHVAGDVQFGLFPGVAS